MKRLIAFIANLLHQLRCDHSDQIHIRNIHGDEINHSPGRSLWVCGLCAKFIYHRELHQGGNSHGQAMVDEAKASMSWDEVVAMERLVIQNGGKRIAPVFPANEKSTEQP